MSNRRLAAFSDALLIVLGLSAGVVNVSLAQLPIIRASICLSDWGLWSSREIRWGEVTIIHMPSGDSLAVGSLRLTMPPVLTKRHVIPAVPAVTGDTAEHRATWVWNTADILRRETLRSELLAFLEMERLDRVFLQLPATVGDSTGQRSLVADGLASLVVSLHARGIGVVAMEGGAEFARPGQHAALANIIRAVGDYNRRAAADARFDGIHLDVEPYLLPGFGGMRRAEIVSSYLAMLSAVREQCRADSLSLAVDIPFWFDIGDAGDTSSTILDRVLPLVDEICVMSYRTTVAGENGIIALAQDEVEAAAAAGKRVWIAIETSPLPDEHLFTISGPPRRGLPSQSAETYLVAFYDHGDSADVFFSPGIRLNDLREMLGKEGRSDASVSVWDRSYLSPLPAKNITFAHRTRAEVNTAIRSLRKRFRAVPGFAGIAVHHWGSFRLLPPGADVR